MWEIEIIKDWNRLWCDDFQAKWLRVMDESPNAHVFFHPALVKAWVDTYLSLRNLDPLFIYGRHNNTNVEVIFPLVLWRQNWKNAFRKLVVPMGHSDFDYHDPIFSKKIDSDSVQSFYQSLLPLLPSADQIVLDGLHILYIPQTFEIKSEIICPCFSLESYSTIEDYSKTLKKSFFNDYLRTSKRLTEQHGDIVNRFYSQEEFQEALLELDVMLDVHRKRWPDAYKAPHFHKNILKEGLESNIVLFTTGSVHGETISWYICFIYKKRLMFYMPTIREEYHTFSPGKISIFNCINYAINNNYSVVDHLKGDEPYKRIWAKEKEVVYNVALNNKSFVSSIKKSINLLSSLLLNLLILIRRKTK